MQRTLSNVELVMRGKGTGRPVLVESMRQALAVHDLRPELAEDIPTITAFRRAADSLSSKAREGTPGIRATVWSTDSGARAVFERETVNGTLRRETIGTVDCATDGSLTVDYSDISSQLRTAYDTARVTYTGADLTAIIRRAMDARNYGQGTYLIRDGVWACPLLEETTVANIGRLERAYESVGAAVLRFAIPDSTSYRAEVSDSIRADIAAALNDHATAIEAYSESTAPGRIVTRRQSLEEMVALIARLQPLLGSHVETLSARVAELIRATDAAEELARANRAGGRRIVIG